MSVHVSFDVINASFSLYLNLWYVRFQVNATVTVIISCQVSVFRYQFCQVLILFQVSVLFEVSVLIKVYNGAPRSD